jgi:peptidoglycan hydrolase-like protein with peptidoglycan-binding domain
VSRRRFRGGRRSLAVAAGTAVAVGLTAGGVALATGAVGSDGDPPADTPSGTAPPATASVTRRDLVDEDSTTGSLGYGDTSTIANARQGTVTWLPAEGQVLGRGQALWRVDTLPTVLMYGTVPLYRTLSTGVTDGADVRQLERNLRALGYTGFTVDKEFTSATAAAVKEWQDDVGLPETGSVDANQVVFAPAPVRVDTRKLTVGGGAAPGPALDVTDTTRLVTVDLDVSDQRLAKTGAAVQVELPGGQRVPGRITSVGKVAHAEKDEQGNVTGATIDVVVTLDAKAVAAAAGAIDQAPVTVYFTAGERKDVLTVPVSALLALSEGGYGVQVVSGGTTKIVAVEVGLFADGDVEVSGAGIAEGTKVGVPAS